MACSTKDGRASPLLALAVMAVIPFALLRLSGAAFLPSPLIAESRPEPTPASGALPTAAAATAAVAGLPGVVFAEEEGGFLNLGKVELGGGFAINLDIPETGIFNIVILIAGLIYLLGPVLSESMATREKEIQEDIDDAVAKYNEAATRLAEAKKMEAQAAEVIAEIQASIASDQETAKKYIEDSSARRLKQEEELADQEIKNLESTYERKLKGFIDKEARAISARQLRELTDAQKTKVLDFSIDTLAEQMKKEGEAKRKEAAKYEKTT